MWLSTITWGLDDTLAQPIDPVRNTCNTGEKTNYALTTGERVNRGLIDHDNPKTLTDSHMSECHMLPGLYIKFSNLWNSNVCFQTG